MSENEKLDKKNKTPISQKEDAPPLEKVQKPVPGQIEKIICEAWQGKIKPARA